MIGTIIFVTEFVIMLLIDQLDADLNPWLEMLWDASLATLIGSVVTYRLIFHPLLSTLRSGDAMRRARFVITLSTVIAEFGLIIFTAEGVIMLLREWLGDIIPSQWINLTDATILALVTMPCIKLWIIPSLMSVKGVRPLRVNTIFAALLIPSLLVIFALFMVAHNVGGSKAVTILPQSLLLWGGLLTVLILGLWAFAHTVVQWNQAEAALEAYAAQLETTVTERTRQLAHAERLATLGTFSASMAHEINNPNAFVAGNAHFLKLYWENAEPILQRHGHEDESGRVTLFLPEIVDTLNGIILGTSRITKIINGLKLYARQDSGESDKLLCRLSEPIQDAANFLVHEFDQGIKLELLVAPEIMITCDRQQICQVFFNLFRNAIEAMEGGQQSRDKWIRVMAVTMNGEVKVTVQDNGLGIPREVADKIFDPFYTTKGKTKGTGLGLALCQGILETHRGRILAESTPGQGALFILFLPWTQV